MIWGPYLSKSDHSDGEWKQVENGTHSLLFMPVFYVSIHWIWKIYFYVVVVTYHWLKPHSYLICINIYEMMDAVSCSKCHHTWAMLYACTNGARFQSWHMRNRFWLPCGHTWYGVHISQKETLEIIAQDKYCSACSIDCSWINLWWHTVDPLSAISYFSGSYHVHL